MKTYIQLHFYVLVPEAVVSNIFVPLFVLLVRGLF